MARRTQRTAPYNPNQLQLFVTPGEVKQRMFPADAALGDEPGLLPVGWEAGDEKAVWDTKDRAIRGEQVIHPTTIRQEQFDPSRAPRVTVSFDDDHDYSDRTQVLVDGAHRVHAAEQYERATGKQVFMPVDYEDD